MYSSRSLRLDSRRAWIPIVLVVIGLTALASLGERGLDAQAQHSWLNAYRRDASRILRAATADDFAWRRLAELTDRFGARMNGSTNLSAAIEWAVGQMKTDGLDDVRTEPVVVPHWVRGHESAEILDGPLRHPMAVLGLGGSVATPAGGLDADVLVVGSFDELAARSAEARGRIVLYNVPFTNYSDSVTYRTSGARVAAQHGAVAALVRSVGPPGLVTLHTGSVQYGSGAQGIPAAAIAAEDASRIARLTAAGRRIRVRLVMSGHQEPDADSANVIGELRGREKPDEIVLVGGHFDSWDVGTGASDDAVGCIVTWEALRIMKALGIRPRRTVRVVLWTNEENGFSGANAYAMRHAASAERHVFALESDSGVFAPATLGFSGSPAARALVSQIVTLLAPVGVSTMGPSGGGADIGPIAEAGNVPTMALLGDPGRYFLVHHSAADTIDRIAPDEVSKAAAAIAVMTYVVAEMPERLPR